MTDIQTEKISKIKTENDYRFLLNLSREDKGKYYTTRLLLLP
jgi:hypothetical protein